MAGTNNININEGAIKMERANRIAVQTIDTGYKADFYRTHKHLATLLSCETGWEADEQANKSAQREGCRKFAIEHSADIGIDWDPTDKRSDNNKRIPKYENDGVLIEDAIKLLWDDMWELVQASNLGVDMGLLSVDSISPVSRSAKGTDLSKLGIIDGKYEKSGNWAWADVEMVLTLTKDGQEIYYTTTCQLVSGQLKKPHITKTAFIEDVKKSLEEAGLLPSEEESKQETTEDSKQEEVQQEVQAEDKPKAKKSRSKKAKAEATAN